MKSNNLPRWLSTLLKYSVFGIAFQLFGVSILLAESSNGQSQKSMTEMVITVAFEDENLRAVFKEIEQQTGLSFVYDNSDINRSDRFTAYLEDVQLNVLLMQLAKEHSLAFHRQNETISVKAVASAGEKTRLVVDEFADITVTGRITDEEGNGLPGATVLLKGTTTGTTTDIDGNFRLTVPEDGTLVISFIGYQAVEVPINSQTVINQTLMVDSEQLEEVVVVGYGEQKKVTVTGAVVAVGGQELVRSPATEISNSLAGRLPGLVVVQESGEPGNDGAKVNIRGTNTLGNSDPLVVIDGIPDRDGGLGRLSPQDIESISVLKDASAAIYGARAANGVILVTTKQGKTGKPTVRFDLNQGFSQPTIVPEMSNAVEYANIMNQIPIYQTIPVDEWDAAWNSIQSSGSYDSPTDGVSTLNANYSPEAIAAHGNGSDPWLYPDTDWFGDAFRDWAPQSRYNLQLSGGTERVRFLSSLGYVFQDGIYKNTATYYKQYNFRINLDADVNDYINTKLGIMSRREDRNYPTQSSGAIFRMLMRGRPTEPEVWPTGQPGPDIENGQNPYVITTNATGYDSQPKDFVQTNGSVDITNPWIEGLKLTLSGAIDYSNLRRKLWETPWELYYLDRETYTSTGEIILEPAIRSNFTDPRLTQRSETVLNTNLTGLLNYERSFGPHNINVLAGVTREKFTGENFFAFRRNYVSAAIDQLFAGGTLQQNTGGSAYERARLGYYGRVQYNFQEKYLLEFIWRYDGSYIFPEQNRFGFFPGVLAGWNITEESFFNVTGIDYLKIRGSFGQMGNDQVAFDFNNNGVIDAGELQEYAFLSSYGFGEYPINSSVNTTLAESILANPNFTWEVANNFNLGMDATVLNNSIDLTLEYFLNRRDQILIQETGSTPSSSGISSLLPPVNAGQVDNEGFEFAINYSNRINDLNFSVGANGGYAQNTVVFMDEIPGAPDYQRQEGKPIRSYLVYESDGVFRDQEDIAANTLDYSGVTGQLIPGDMKFKDTNGDGIIDGDDQIRLDENNVPKFNFGATIDAQWRNFDFSMLLQGATGASIRIQTESGDIGNFLKWHHDNRWSIENPSSKHPRLASRGDTYYTGGGYGNNTYNLFSKDYIRIKNIEIGYNVPNTIGGGNIFRSLRVYVNALNLVTWDKNNIFDPEATAENGVYYPLSRVINTGLSLTF